VGCGVNAYQRGNRDALVEVLTHLRREQDRQLHEMERFEAALRSPNSVRRMAADRLWEAARNRWMHTFQVVQLVENLASTTPEDPEEGAC
jgi:hypothetical protein